MRTQSAALQVLCYGAALVGCSDGNSGLDGPDGGAGGIRMPVEVLGPTGYTRSVEFELPTSAGIDTLSLRGHHLAYRDAALNPSRAKASVRLNDGPWVDLINQNVTCAAQEAQFGCLSGAYHTVRLTVPITGARDGVNRLEFRHNASDGYSTGYRILSLNLLAGTTPVMPPTAFSDEDSAPWTPPLDTPDDIAAGRRLWTTKVLETSPLNSGKLRATCDGCHARDGRDLKYFNYSNWSIEARSVFHGLTPTEGQQIASYIRSLATPAPAAARPWNPPYQPCPGLDSRPVEQWAAGGGLDCVLEEDSDMATHLFPGGTSPAAVQAALSLTAYQNPRELPIALQLPDWNEWLPESHPIDTIGDSFNDPMFDRGIVGAGVNPTYQRVHELYAANDDAWGTFDFFVSRVAALGAEIQRAIPTDLVVQAVVTANDPVQLENMARSLHHWSAVKQWEILQEYKLEDSGPRQHGPKADARSWLVAGRNVFELAPHRTAVTEVGEPSDIFTFQTLPVSKYFSTAWYQTQVTINTGAGFTGGLLAPVDWNYQPDHIANLMSSDVGGPAQPLRLAATNATMLHVYATSNFTPTNGGQWGFRQFDPARYAPGGGGQDGVFATLPDPLRRSIYAALLSATMDLLERFTPAEHHTAGSELEPATHIPALIDRTTEDFNYQRHIGRFADCWYTMIGMFRADGVDEAVLTRMINWGAAMWPRGDWNARRL
jgi:hypothetical protein